MRRVLEELLEDPPLALARRRAERGGLVVGHVERDRRRPGSGASVAPVIGSG